MKKHIAFIVSTILVLCQYSAMADNGDKDKTKAKKYTLFAAGDVNLGRWVPQTIYEKGPDWPIEEVSHLSRNADIALTNIECVVATRGWFYDKGEGRPHLYRGRPEMLDLLINAGYDVVTVANNHGMDYGGEALLEELEILDAVGIAHTGGGKNMKEASEPAYVKVGDIIVAFIGMEHHFPKYAAGKNKPGIFHVKGARNVRRALVPVIEEARKNADLVVFTPHWGKNWKENVIESRQRLARWIIDQGVDAILGHSSHHIHGIEIYKGKPIVYDMGSFYFDRVQQHRMRYSAVFVLEFSKLGFTKLIAHPVRLKTNRTVAANASETKRVHNLLKKLSKEIDPQIEFETDGQALTLTMQPDTEPHARSTDPISVHQTGTTRPLPEDIRKRKTVVVVETPPKWTEGFKPVAMERGITVLGGTNSDAVWPGRAFVAEIALKVSGPIDGAWVGVVKGERRGDGREFYYPHPIADAGWNASLWEDKQIVIDRTLVRLQAIPEGIYDLSWGFSPLRRGEFPPVKILNPPQGGDDQYVPFGKILVTQKGIPNGAAGVAWDGLLRPSKALGKDKLEEHLAKTGKNFGALWTGIGAGFLFLIIFIILYVRDKKRQIL